MEIWFRGTQNLSFFRLDSAKRQFTFLLRCLCWMLFCSQNGHHPFPVPQMTISQPSACISFQPSTLPAAPVTQMPAAAAAAACGGLQPAPPYLQAVHAPQPVTLTIRQPNLISPPPVAAPAPVVQSDQAVPPPLSQGPGSSSASPNTPRHIRDQTPSSFSSYSEGSDASSRHNGGGFTLEDMSNLWNHPPQPNGHVSFMSARKSDLREKHASKHTSYKPNQLVCP